MMCNFSRCEDWGRSNMILLRVWGVVSLVWYQLEGPMYVRVFFPPYRPEVDGGCSLHGRFNSPSRKNSRPCPQPEERLHFSVAGKEIWAGNGVGTEEWALYLLQEDWITYGSPEQPFLFGRGDCAIPT